MTSLLTIIINDHLFYSSSSLNLFSISDIFGEKKTRNMLTEMFIFIVYSLRYVLMPPPKKKTLSYIKEWAYSQVNIKINLTY